MTSGQCRTAAFAAPESLGGRRSLGEHGGGHWSVIIFARRTTVRSGRLRRCRWIPADGTPDVAQLAELGVGESIEEELADALSEAAPEGLERELLGAHLAAALEGIPAADRDALLLLAWADLDYEQIATALDIPLGTVRSRIHRARQRVREYLETAEDLQVRTKEG
jgi:RNA polymerase sigma factor (sigma-70 family)